MLMECERYTNERGRLLEAVTGQMGVEEWNGMGERNENTQVRYLLGLLVENKCTVQVSEWVKEFLECAWSIRRRVTEQQRVHR